MSAGLHARLLAWYERHGRHDLPWRTDRAPYRIVVAEYMLQQTQVERVVPLFAAFVARFDGFAALADASTADVLRAWKGLGYNSRALRLQALARAVAARPDGTLPCETDALRALPGVGPYTVRAIRAFAFDVDEIAFDVNVRRITHRVLYGVEVPARAGERELDARAQALLPPGRGFAWNSALMDLGASLCSARTPKCLICPLAPVCAAAPIDPALLAHAVRAHAKPRSPQERIPFARTTRYVRGRIVDRLRALACDASLQEATLIAEIAVLAPSHPPATIAAILARLAADGLVERTPDGLRLRT